MKQIFVWKVCRALFSLFLVSASFSLFAQTPAVRTGTVSDLNGVVSGVSVAVKGSSRGTTSNAEGKFSISASNGETLVFSGPEIEILEILVTAELVYNVNVTHKTNSLDQVIVVGYGSRSKRAITGAISRVNMSETENAPNTNVTQALRGRVAGVQFTDNGRPGQNGSILIRGQRSISASNNPLIVLDGIFFNGSFLDINPNDIESMEVLKDASAAAIYGSRAANGVILITSKKGKTEKPTIRVNSFYGTSDWAKKLDLMKPERYLQKSMAIRDALNLPYDPNDPSSYLTLTEADNLNAGRTIDAYDMISQKANIFSTDISVAGRTDKVNYFISASQANEKGLVLNDNLKRSSFRTNLDLKITDWLTIGTNAMYSENIQKGVPALVARALRQSPYGTWFREDGTPTQFTVPEDGGASGNPLRPTHLQAAENVRSNLFANGYAIVKIPGIEGLSYRLNVSANSRWIRDYNLTKQDPYLTANTSEASKRNWKAADWVVENIIDYNRRFGKDHAIDVTLMYGSNKFTSESTTATATQLASDVLGWNNLQSGAIFTVRSSADRTSGISSMARLNYRFKNKYLLTLTARRDGSSVFAANNKYATFPSAALSWIASDEQFIKDLNIFDMLKLRTSYGAVGNQAIDPYQSLSLASTNYYVFGDGAPSSLGIYPSNISNADLKWETTYIANIGLDFSVLKGRVGGSVELYHMKTNDLLVERSLPGMTGYTSIWTNLGRIDNKGIEITLNTVNVKSNKFEWRSDFVFSTNQNKIVSLYGSDADGDGKEDDDLGNRWFIGSPIDVYYDYVYDGLYQHGDIMPTGFAPGFAKFLDLNNDGNLTAADDRRIVGQKQPKYRWGITNTFSYSGFQLSVFINAMQGWIGEFNEIDYNFDSIDPQRPSNMINSDWWTPENTGAARPTLDYKRSILGHNWYSSRDFIRVQDVSLAYNLPANLLSKFKVANMSVYASAKNLATFTDWQGTNPETISSYPISKSLVLGIRASF